MEQIKSAAVLDKSIKECTAVIDAKLKGTNGKRAVLICGGTGCLANNSDEILHEFEKEIKAHGLEQKVSVNHALTLWNSLGNELQEFKPIVPGEVSMYVCGPTVYASPHIGNMRPAIVFDTLRRLLIHLGYKVTYVSNYTDVDDKIIARAKELGVSEAALTEGVIKEYARLIDQIGCLQPDIKPRPTVYMIVVVIVIAAFAAIFLALEDLTAGSLISQIKTAFGAK